MPTPPKDLKKTFSKTLNVPHANGDACVQYHIQEFLLGADLKALNKRDALDCIINANLDANEDI